MANEHPPTTSHNYLPLLLDFVARNPSATDINVGHDSWCGIYKGQFCNCNPTLQPWTRQLE